MFKLVEKNATLNLTTRGKVAVISDLRNLLKKSKKKGKDKSGNIADFLSEIMKEAEASESD